MRAQSTQKPLFHETAASSQKLRNRELILSGVELRSSSGNLEKHPTDSISGKTKFCFSINRGHLVHSSEPLMIERVFLVFDIQNRWKMSEVVEAPSHADPRLQKFWMCLRKFSGWPEPLTQSMGLDVVQRQTVTEIPPLMHESALRRCLSVLKLI